MLANSEKRYFKISKSVKNRFVRANLIDERVLGVCGHTLGYTLGVLHTRWLTFICRPSSVDRMR